MPNNLNEESLILLKRADEIAANAHKGQVDKAGENYYLHPLRVSAMGKTEEEKIVGLLHDIVEDTTVTLENLREAGFPNKIVGAIDCLTKRKGEDDLSYLARVKENHLAKTIKLYDVADNSSPDRMSKLPSFERKRLIEKYSLTKKVLLGS